MKSRPDLILLIDDDEDDNFFHQRAIQKSGLKCRIDICTSGDTAMDYLSNRGEFSSRGAEIRHPDLIFLDINMPRVNGWEFMDQYTQWVNDNDYDPATVIVMVSTSGQTVDIERAKVTPFVGCFVEKPLKPESVLEIVDQYFH
ncbi:MAG: response regulator [Granulosicoccus sp.]